MPQANKQSEASLNQRVSNYLRDTHSPENPFASKAQSVINATEIDRCEFELERALSEMRAIQRRIKKLRREIHDMKGGN